MWKPKTDWLACFINRCSSRKMLPINSYLKRWGLHIDVNIDNGSKQHYINNNKNETIVTAEEKVLFPWFQNMAQCFRVSLPLKCPMTGIAFSKTFMRTAVERDIWQFLFFPLAIPKSSLLKITSLTIRYQWIRRD